MLAAKVIQITAIFCATVCCCLGDIGSCSIRQTAVTDDCLRNLKNSLVQMDLKKICSYDYFHVCRQMIAVELGSCISKQQVDFVMANIEARLDGGIRYLCANKEHIKEAWNKCGSNCSYTLIGSYHLCGFMDVGYYPTTTLYSESDCRKMDNTAICIADKFKSSFPESKVDGIILQYHRSITLLSPCRSVSVFSESVANSKRSYILLIISTVFLAMMQYFH